MAATFLYCMDSPRGSMEEIELHGVVQGTTNMSEAYALAYRMTPAFALGIPRKTDPLKVTPINNTDWDIVATYAKSSGESGKKNDDDKDAGDADCGFDFTMETLKITQAIRHVGRHSAPGEGLAPDFGGGIGFDGQTFQGCEIGVPKGELHEKWIVPGTFLTPTYLDTLYQTIGKVNIVLWRGKKAGELLLLGVSGQDRGDGAWTLSWKYGYSRDEVNLARGNIVIPHKEGWDYVWVYFRDKDVDLGGGRTIKSRVPVHAYVEQVYPRADFANLEIGAEAWDLANQMAWARRQQIGRLGTILSGWPELRRQRLQAERDDDLNAFLKFAFAGEWD